MHRFARSFLHRCVFLLLGAGALAAGGGCHLLDFRHDPPPPATAEPVRLFDPPGPADRYTDPASLHAAYVEGDVLVVDVSYGGGCAEHDFALFAARVFLESEPPQAILLLSHEDHDDACDALLSDTLRFDLSPLKAAYHDVYRHGGRLRLRLYAPERSPATGEPFHPQPVYVFE